MSPRLISFLYDANDFIISFRNVIERSVPHIYLSALPWVRRSSMVAEIFGPWFPNTITVTIQGIERRQRTLLYLRGHSDSVKSVSLQSDCSRIVSGSSDGTIRVWDAKTGEEVVKAFKLASNASIHSVSFSPDGKHIVLGSSDSHVGVLAVSGDVVIEHLRLEGHSEAVTCVAFSPDGRYIVSGSRDRTIRIWGVVTGKEISETIVRICQRFGVYSVCFTPSGNHDHILSHTWNGGIQMWDARTGMHIWSRIFDRLTCFSLSPDGEHIIAGCGAKLRFWNWRVDSGMKKFVGHDNAVHSVGFSPDGCYVVSGSGDRTVRVWDIKTGKEVVEPLKGHTASVLSVYFSRGRIISGSEDQTIRVWDADIPIGKGMEHPNTSHISAFSCVDISPDGTYILSGSDDNTLRVMDSKTGEEVMKRHVLRVSSARFSPDGGSRIVSGSFDGCVTVWDAKTGKEIMTLRKGIPDCAILCVGFSSDGMRIFASCGGTIWVWDANTGKLIVELYDHRGLAGSLSSVELSPDGKFIVSNSMELDLQWPWPTMSRPGPVYGIPLWDVRERVNRNMGLLATRDYRVDLVCFSPSGSRIVTGSWNTIQIWDVSTGQAIMTLRDANMCNVNSLCFSRDGRHFVSGSDDGVVRVWDAILGRTSMKWNAHTSPIRSIRCSSDGSQIVSYSSDKTIRVWDTRLAEKVMRVLPNPEGNILPDIGCADLLLKLDDQNNRLLTMLNIRLISSPDKHNGWMTGPNGELIFWVPAEYRSSLMLPPCTLLIGASRDSFDPARFVHGVEWAKCWSGP